MKELEKEISTRKWKSECLEKFVMFLKELYKYPNHYKRIVINSDLEDSETGNLKRVVELSYLRKRYWVEMYEECDGYISYAEMMLDLYCDNGGHE